MWTEGQSKGGSNSSEQGDDSDFQRTKEQQVRVRATAVSRLWTRKACICVTFFKDGIMLSRLASDSLYTWGRLSSFLRFAFISCVWGFDCIYIHVPYTCLGPTEARKGCQVPSLELELQIVVSSHVGARNWASSSARAVLPSLSPILTLILLAPSPKCWLQPCTTIPSLCGPGTQTQCFMHAMFPAPLPLSAYFIENI